MTIRKAHLSAGGASGTGSNTFRINWKGKIDKWGTHGKALPIDVHCSAVSERLNRDQGRTFLLPSLAKACGTTLSLDRVDRNITVDKIQEGGDSGIFKVTAKVDVDGKRTVSFCLNSAKHPDKNQLHNTIMRNLARVRRINPEYAVRPYYLGPGIAQHEREEVSLAMLSTEWLEGYMELSMINMAEDLTGRRPDPGMAAMGLKRLLINHPSAGETIRDAIIKDAELASAIAEEMVKIFTLYFNPATGECIQQWGINNGDFVYKPNPDGTFSLKLVSIRSFAPIRTPDHSIGQHFNAFPFIDRLLTMRETSVSHQHPDPWAETLSIHPFTPTDICRGIRAGLIEIHGEKEGKAMLIKWLATYAMANSLSQRMGDCFQLKERLLRSMMMQQEIKRFLVDEIGVRGEVVI